MSEEITKLIEQVSKMVEKAGETATQADKWRSLFEGFESR